ncbi:MAG: hypothetical protein EBS90_12555 [Betaproteobacteria bacterium]|nr:hypothetical protein [Betaproteobacteria bacterium]
MNPLVSPGAGPIPGVPSQQPTNLFRYGEITLYSSFGFAAGTALANSTNRVFVTPLGAQGQGFVGALTKTETNLKEGGRIPSGQAYDVYGVATQILGADNTAGLAGQTDEPFNDNVATVQGLQNIVSNGVISWDFTQTQVDICPVMLAGAGGGLFGAISQNAAGANSGAMNNGNGGIWMYRKHPVALPGSTTFAVQLQFGSRAAAIPAGFGVVVRVVLLGYYKSVVEIG